MGLVWLYLVVYQVSTFFCVWIWSKRLVWWWVGAGDERNFSVHPWSKTRTLIQAEQPFVYKGFLGSDRAKMFWKRYVF